MPGVFRRPFELPRVAQPALPLTESPNKRIVVEGAALALTGRAVDLARVFAVTPPTLTLTGRAVDLARSLAVTKAGLTLTGAASVFAITEAISKGDIALTGRSVVLNRGMPVAAAALALSGQAVSLYTVTFMAVTPGHLTLAGRTTTLTPLLPFNPTVSRAPLMIPKSGKTPARYWRGTNRNA